MFLLPKDTMCVCVCVLDYVFAKLSFKRLFNKTKPKKTQESLASKI